MGTFLGQLKMAQPIFFEVLVVGGGGVLGFLYNISGLDCGK